MIAFPSIRAHLFQGLKTFSVFVVFRAFLVLDGSRLPLRMLLSAVYVFCLVRHCKICLVYNCDSFVCLLLSLLQSIGDQKTANALILFCSVLFLCKANV